MGDYPLTAGLHVCDPQVSNPACEPHSSISQHFGDPRSCQSPVSPPWGPCSPTRGPPTAPHLARGLPASEHRLTHPGLQPAPFLWFGLAAPPRRLRSVCGRARGGRGSLPGWPSGLRGRVGGTRKPRCGHAVSQNRPLCVLHPQALPWHPGTITETAPRLQQPHRAPRSLVPHPIPGKAGVTVSGLPPPPPARVLLSGGRAPAVGSGGSHTPTL